MELNQQEERACRAIMMGAPLSVVALSESNMEELKSFTRFHAQISRWEEMARANFFAALKSLNKPG